MTDQVLSVEQMQELKELGIDTSKASMCWIGCADGNDIYPYNKTFRKCFEEHLDTIPLVLTPTFTLQDILEMLPTHKTFSECNRTYNRCWVRLCAPMNDNIHTELSNKSLLDASFKMLKWCKVNNCI